MTARAHHVVVETIESADGVSIRGRGDVYEVYCTPDEIGRRTVVAESRLRADRSGETAPIVHVSYERGSFVVTRRVPS